MKLNFSEAGRTQPDPFIFEDNGRYYLYVTAGQGVEAYESSDPFGVWTYKGIVTAFEEGATDFWAPSVIKLGAVYYMYVSCIQIALGCLAGTPGAVLRQYICQEHHFLQMPRLIDAGKTHFFTRQHRGSALIDFKHAAIRREQLESVFLDYVFGN